MRLRFAPDGSLLTPSLPLLEIPLPVILDMPAWPVECQHWLPAGGSRGRLETVAVIPAEECRNLAPEQYRMLSRSSRTRPVWRISTRRAASLRPCGWRSDGRPGDCAAAGEDAGRLPGVVISVRMVLTPGTADRIAELVHTGARVFQVCATSMDVNALTTDGPDGISRTLCGRFTAGWWSGACGTR